MSTLIKRNGTWAKVAGHTVWVGTVAQREAALEAGKLPDGTEVMTTNDYEDNNKVTTVTLEQPSGLSTAGYDCCYVKAGKVVVVYIYIVLTTDLAASTVFVQGLPKAADRATVMLNATNSTDKLRAYIQTNSTVINNRDIPANAGTYLGQLVYIAAD